MLTRFIPAMLVCSCGGYKLPPPEVLQSGCHVWYNYDNSGRGVSADIAANGTAKLQARGGVADARLRGASEVEWDGDVIGRIEGTQITVGKGAPLEPWYLVDVAAGPQQLVVRYHDDGKTFITLQRSAGCTPIQSAIGVAPVSLLAHGEIMYGGGPAHNNLDDMMKPEPIKP